MKEISERSTQLIPVIIDFHDDARRFEEIKKALNMAWFETVKAENDKGVNVRWAAYQSLSSDLI